MSAPAMRELQEFLYLCVRELSYVQEAEDWSQVKSSHGGNLVDRGMKLLGVADLSTESIPPERVLDEASAAPASTPAEPSKSLLRESLEAETLGIGGSYGSQAPTSTTPAEPLSAEREREAQHRKAIGEWADVISATQRELDEATSQPAPTGGKVDDSQIDNCRENG
jgi:hypothetical protein